jgi:hypothetical protein
MCIRAEGHVVERLAPAATMCKQLFVKLLSIDRAILQRERFREPAASLKQAVKTAWKEPTCPEFGLAGGVLSCSGTIRENVFGKAVYRFLFPW